MTEEESEEEEEERGAETQRPQSAQPRDLVQSPFDTAHESPTTLPIRTDEAPGAEEKSLPRQMSDVGSFENVKL